MEFKDRIFKTKLDGREVYVLDSSYISIKDNIKSAIEIDKILKENRGMIYILINGYKSDFNFAVINAWKKVINKYDFVEYRAAIYGVDWIRILAVKFTNLTNPHSVCCFKTKEEAEKHLIDSFI